MKNERTAIDRPVRGRISRHSHTALRCRMGLLLLGAAVLFSGRLAAFPPDEADNLDQQQSDLDKMQGVWRVVRSQVGDEQAAPDEMARRRVTIKDDKLIYEYGNPQNERLEGTIKLDPETHAFDFSVPFENATAFAIYELKNDTLRIGIGNDGMFRPKRWEVSKDNVSWLLVLKRDRDSEADSGPAEPDWIADASTTDFPDQPAAGRLHGEEFIVGTARIAPYHEFSGNVGDPPEKQNHVDGAVLTLQAEKVRQPRNDYTIFLAVKPGEKVDAKSFTVPAGGLFKQTKKIMDKDGRGWFYPVAGVQVRSGEPDGKPRTDLLPKVTMRLKFGRRKNDRLRGTIYLCVDDPEKSFVAGSFDAVIEEDEPAFSHQLDTGPTTRP